MPESAQKLILVDETVLDFFLVHENRNHHFQETPDTYGIAPLLKSVQDHYAQEIKVIFLVQDRHATPTESVKEFDAKKAALDMYFGKTQHVVNQPKEIERSAAFYNRIANKTDVLKSDILFITGKTEAIAAAAESGIALICNFSDVTSTMQAEKQKLKDFAKLSV